MSMKIYTRTGDAGETGLFGGGRVAQGPSAGRRLRRRRRAQLGHRRRPRHRAGGRVRRAARLGPARPLRHRRPPGHARSREGGQGAGEGRARGRADRAEFERLMDAADEELPPLRAFVLPAGTPKAAALHLARTVCRRAERSVVRLAHEEAVPGAVPGLPQPALRPALHPGAPGQPPGRRGRRDVVARRPGRSSSPTRSAAIRSTSRPACSAGSKRWSASTPPARARRDDRRRGGARAAPGRPPGPRALGRLGARSFRRASSPRRASSGRG